MRCLDHVYIYCLECRGAFVEPGKPEAYCYSIGPEGGLFGMPYFNAKKHRKIWPPEMAQVKKPPTPEEEFRERWKAYRCRGCGKAETKNHPLNVSAGFLSTAPGVPDNVGSWWNKECLERTHPEQAD